MTSATEEQPPEFLGGDDFGLGVGPHAAYVEALLDGQAVELVGIAGSVDSQATVGGLPVQLGCLRCRRRVHQLSL
jgi:hypothetical protein